MIRLKKMEEDGSNKKKKVLLIVGVLTIVLIVILLLLFFRRGDEDSSWFGLFPGGDRSGERQPQPLPPDDRDRDFLEFQGEIPRLRQISFVPTAGAGTLKENRVVDNDDEPEEREVTLIRYTERQTGHVYETSTDSFRTIRISNTTIPRIYESLWLPGGASQLVRYFDKDANSIKTFYGTLTNKDEEGGSLDDRENKMELKGGFLVNNIPHVAISETSSRIFYVLPPATLVGQARGISAASDGSDAGQIFSSSFSEWLPQWPNTGTIALTTKASFDVPGFLFFLNTQSGSFDRVIKDVPGLTTLTNPKGDLILYSESTTSGIKLSVYDVGRRESRAVTLFNTLPEKCAWSRQNPDIVYCGASRQIPRAKYPDEWYQGQVHFSDNLWSLNARTMASENLINLNAQSKQEIDVIKPFLDEDEGYLVFTNKRDMTVWSYRIKELSDDNFHFRDRLPDNVGI
jgi:hypothetical protein